MGCHFLLQCMKVKSESEVAQLCQLSGTPLTVGHQATLFMGFPRQEYWSGLPFPSPGNLPDPGIKPVSPALQADSLQSELPEKPTYIYTNNFLLHVVCLCCRFFPLIDDHKILNIVPFAIQ